MLGNLIFFAILCMSEWLQQSHGSWWLDTNKFEQIGKFAREFQKNIYFCFIDYAKVFDYVGHNKL